jgi:hypothetical protein
MSNSKKQHGGLLSATVIKAASEGDSDAMRAVLKRYEGYILALSTIKLYDKDGVPHSFIDETLRSTLEMRLITKTVGFKFMPAL